MGISVAPVPVGKDLGVTLARTVVTTKVLVQGHIPWLDLMDRTGEEMLRGIWIKPVKARMPKLKNLGSLARSREENNKMKRVLALRRTQQKGVTGQMTLKEKPLLQIPGEELRGAGQVQTFDVMIIRGNTLRLSDGKDQSNQPNHHLKKKWTQKG